MRRRADRPQLTRDPLGGRSSSSLDDLKRQCSASCADADAEGPASIDASHARSRPMPTPVDRRAVDLAAFPNLVVIYLDMRVRTFAGIKTLLGLGPQIDKAGAARPEGLLHFENNIIFRLFPLHIGMRWYWKDFESMEQWTRSERHRIWWQNFIP